MAIDYARGWGLDAIWARVTYLAGALRAGLGALPGVTLHDRGRERCGIVTFVVAGQAPHETQRRLAARGINVSVSLAEYARLDMAARGLDSLVRASLHYYNTGDEIARFCQAIAEIA